MHDEKPLPDGWEAGIGEANRPLEDGGYYQHRYFRTLPGSNQHVEKFLELVVDTVGMPPDKHSLELNRCRDNGEEIIREERLANATVSVFSPEYDEEQEAAEQEIHDRAHELMEENSG